MMTAVEFRVSLASTLWCLASCNTAYAQCQSTSHTLTFSEFAVGTTIITNYADHGVLFASGGGFPFITTDSSNPSSPVLSGQPLFAGPITASFVSPSDSSKIAATQTLTFQAGFFDQLGSTSISYFDVNHVLLSTVTNSALGIESFTAPAGTASFSVTTADDAGYAIDNMSYTLGPSSALAIATPGVNSEFGLTQNSLTRSGDIAFSASGTAATGKVSWTVTMEYDTDTPHQLPSLETAFNTNGTGTKAIYYQSRGGRGRVQAIGGSSQAPVEACPLEYFYVVGSAISATDVTARLQGLYSHGATPRLLTGIAFRESSYHQFVSRDKYGHVALWPNESSQDGGSHVGLMQVGTGTSSGVSGAQGVKNAWDWQENTKFAADLFDEKLRIAAARERRARQQNHGLRALTALEIENWAVLLYGPYPLNGPYYIVATQPDGSVDWAVNSAGNPLGIGYVNSIRANIQ